MGSGGQRGHNGERSILRAIGSGRERRVRQGVKSGRQVGCAHRPAHHQRRCHRRSQGQPRSGRLDGYSSGGGGGDSDGGDYFGMIFGSGAPQPLHSAAASIVLIILTLYLSSL